MDQFRSRVALHPPGRVVDLGDPRHGIHRELARRETLRSARGCTPVPQANATAPARDVGVEARMPHLLPDCGTPINSKGPAAASARASRASARNSDQPLLNASAILARRFRVQRVLGERAARQLLGGRPGPWEGTFAMPPFLGSSGRSLGVGAVLATEIPPTASRCA